MFESGDFRAVQGRHAWQQKGSYMYIGLGTLLIVILLIVLLT